jgi:hypothetical protein
MTIPTAPLLLLNATVLTSFGVFRHRRLSLAEACALVQELPWESAIGHPATARLVSAELDITCPTRRVAVEQRAGQPALVFRLNSRAPLGADHDDTTLRTIGHHWTLMERLE